MTHTCDETAKLCEAYLDGERPRADVESLRTEVVSCASCVAEIDSALHLATELAAAIAPYSAPEGAAYDAGLERVLAALAQEPGWTTTPSPTITNDRGTAPSPTPRSAGAARSAEIIPFRGFRFLLSAAAGLIVVASAIVVMRPGRQGVPSFDVARDAPYSLRMKSGKHGEVAETSASQGAVVEKSAGSGEEAAGFAQTGGAPESASQTASQGEPAEGGAIVAMLEAARREQRPLSEATRDQLSMPANGLGEPLPGGPRPITQDGVKAELQPADERLTASRLRVERAVGAEAAFDAAPDPAHPELPHPAHPEPFDPAQGGLVEGERASSATVATSEIGGTGSQATTEATSEPEADVLVAEGVVAEGALARLKGLIAHAGETENKAAEGRAAQVSEPMAEPVDRTIAAGLAAKRGPAGKRGFEVAPEGVETGVAPTGQTKIPEAGGAAGSATATPPPFTPAPAPPTVDPAATGESFDDAQDRSAKAPAKPIGGQMDKDESARPAASLSGTLVFTRADRTGAFGGEGSEKAALLATTIHVDFASGVAHTTIEQCFAAPIAGRDAAQMPVLSGTYVLAVAPERVLRFAATPLEAESVEERDAVEAAPLLAAPFADEYTRVPGGSVIEDGWFTHTFDRDALGGPLRVSFELVDAIATGSVLTLRLPPLGPITEAGAAKWASKAGARPAGLRVAIDIAPGEPVLDVRSPTHAVRVARLDPSRLTVTLRDDRPALDRELILEVHLARPSTAE